VLGLIVAACAPVAHQRSGSATDDIPAAWSGADRGAQTGSAALSRWWVRFDDAQLADLIDQALQINTSVKSAQAALRQARALRDVAAAALLPVVNSSASAQHGTSGGHSTGNLFKAGFDASWEIDVFGVQRHAVDASEAAAQASATSLGDVQVSIAAEVALAYITLRSAQTRLAIATENLASQQETLQITRWRAQAGLVTTLETEQARAAAEQTAALLPALQTSIEQTVHALAVLVGRPPAALKAKLVVSAPVPQARDDLALSIPAETLRQRADVRTAEYQVAAALAKVGQAEAARWPGFALGGSLGLAASTFGSLTDSASVLSTLLASVRLPVFDGGALRSQVRAQQAALDQSEQAYRAAVLAALKDVEDALVALRGDRLRLVSLRNAADAGTNAALLARQRFSSGLVDFQVVLETQRTQLSTQDSLASAGADVSADHVRLYKALGGGWRSEVSHDAPSTSSSMHSAEKISRNSKP
jgi:NodT family efflux transporter outer membrane factor (OMF) lipoprotein